MRHYSGITTDPHRQRQEHQRTKRNLRNWTIANGGMPFANRQTAEIWEDRHPGEHDPGGGPASGRWYGYSFDYDSEEESAHPA